MLRAYVLFLLATCIVGVAACASAQQKPIDQKLRSVDGARWFSGAFEVSCDQKAVQGEQIMTVFSVGKTEAEALREARRNAVRAIVFRGIQTSACTEPPLLTPDKLTEKADKYFDEFFREAGQYLAYVEYSGDEVESRVKVGKQIKIGSIVTVHVGRLRADLEKAGIIESMSGIFRSP